MTTSQIFIICPSCQHCEAHEFFRGETLLRCGSCLRLFRVLMYATPTYENHKTTIELVANVYPVRVNPIQFEVAA